MGSDQGLTYLFYDGDCGLCHGAVAFLVRRDAAERLHFAPIGGPLFRQKISLQLQRGLPESLLLLTPGSRLLVRSDAVLGALACLGGTWAPVAKALDWVPRPLRDAGYDLIAAVRKRLFPAPQGSCPRLPPDLLRRFEP
jgi:predicted DCC family thiol-disulfide oxidoreductase YuxK